MDQSALDVSHAGNTPEATGKIKNETGQPITDVTVQIRNKGTGNGNTPFGGTVTITEGGKKNSGTFTVIAGSSTHESEATVGFSGGTSPIGSLGLLQDPADDFNTAPGVTTTISGSQFTLSGFNLGPSKEYEIVVILDAPPQTTTSLALEATFEAP